jgi:hypothetical protein
LVSYHVKYGSSFRKNERVIAATVVSNYYGVRIGSQDAVSDQFTAGTETAPGTCRKFKNNISWFRT